MELGSLGRYELRGELGRGTMGIVYRGFDPVLEREVALKTVRLSPALSDRQREKFLARFFREARIAGKLLHPNIVVTHDAATEGGVPFIAMELVSGGSLRDRVAEGALPWSDAIRLVVPIAGALDYAHELGIVHRDVKPANVLITRTGVPKLADFGIARLPSSEITESGAIMGTPHYMAPEQLETDEVDGRSDVFALGALFYALVLGRPPFAGTDIATITKQVLYKEPRPLSECLSGVPAALDGVLARALAKRPEDRYQRADELAYDLARVGRGEEPDHAVPLGERTLESVPRPRPSATLPRQDPAGPGAEPFVPDPAAAAVPPSPTASARTPAPTSKSGSGIALLGAALALVLVLGRDVVPRGVEAFLDDRRVGAERELAEEQASLRLETARDLGERGHFRPALEGVEASLRLFQDARSGTGEARALLLRGATRAAEGRWSEARADMDAACAVFSIYDAPVEAARARAAFADLERDGGAFERAETLYDQALAGGAGSEAIVGKALLWMMRGEHERAVEALESVALGDPMRPRANLYLWALTRARSETETAERYWSLAATHLDPSEAALWRGYAALAAGAETGDGDGDGDTVGGERHFREALAGFSARDHRTGITSATEGLSGRKLESKLGTIFLALPRTARTEALAARF